MWVPSRPEVPPVPPGEDAGTRAEAGPGATVRFQASLQAADEERAAKGMDNRMIAVTRLGGSEVVINTDLIVTVEKTPDTVITLTTGDRIMVRESVEEVVARAAAFRHRVMQGPGVRADARDVAAALGSGSVRLPERGDPPSSEGNGE